jgi:crossover junction endodeoxyribonuclease RuvC
MTASGSFTILGVDPGLSGALALLQVNPNGVLRLLSVADMPLVAVKKSTKTQNEINLPLLSVLVAPPMAELPARAVIELVHAMPGQGVVSMFRFGQALGAVSGVCAALGIPTTFMPPREWQRAVRHTGRADKSASRLLASELYPEKAHLFSRVKDDGRAEAVLIATAAAKLIFHA